MLDFHSKINSKVLSWLQNKSMKPSKAVRCPRGVMVKAMDGRSDVSEFKLQLLY